MDIWECLLLAFIKYYFEWHLFEAVSDFHNRLLTQNIDLMSKRVKTSSRTLLGDLESDLARSAQQEDSRNEFK